MNKQRNLVMFAMYLLVVVLTGYFLWDHKRQWLATTAYSFMIVIALDSSRHRARWANFIYILIGIIGVGGAMLDHLLAAGIIESPQLLPYYLIIMRGMILGMFLAIIFSGQLLGRKIGKGAKGVEIDDAKAGMP